MTERPRKKPGRKTKAEKEAIEMAAEQFELDSLRKEVEATKQKIIEEEAKKPIVKAKKMVQWVRGIFNFVDQPGEVLSFIYNENRLALKDKEKAEIPLEIANHLNSLKYNVVAWVREEKDTHEGQQGTKKVVGTRERCTFTIFDHFEMPQGTRVGFKPNERANA